MAKRSALWHENENADVAVTRDQCLFSFPSLDATTCPTVFVWSGVVFLSASSPLFPFQTRRPWGRFTCERCARAVGLGSYFFFFHSCGRPFAQRGDGPQLVQHAPFSALHKLVADAFTRILCAPLFVLRSDPVVCGTKKKKRGDLKAPTILFIPSSDSLARALDLFLLQAMCKTERKVGKTKKGQREKGKREEKGKKGRDGWAYGGGGGGQ